MQSMSTQWRRTPASGRMRGRPAPMLPSNSSREPTSEPCRFTCQSTCCRLFWSTGATSLTPAAQIHQDTSNCSPTTERVLSCSTRVLLASALEASLESLRAAQSHPAGSSLQKLQVPGAPLQQCCCGGPLLCSPGSQLICQLPELSLPCLSRTHFLGQSLIACAGKHCWRKVGCRSGRRS